MIRAEISEFNADTCGGIVGIDLPAHCLSVILFDLLPLFVSLP